MKEEEKGVCRYHISKKQETQYEWGSVYKLFVKYTCTTEKTEHTEREQNIIIDEKPRKQRYFGIPENDIALQ